jgi:hypothetical protein
MPDKLIGEERLREICMLTLPVMTYHCNRGFRVYLAGTTRYYWRYEFSMRMRGLLTAEEEMKYEMLLVILSLYSFYSTIHTSVRKPSIWLFRIVISASIHADLRIISHESALFLGVCKPISLWGCTLSGHCAGLCASGAVVCPRFVAPPRRSEGYGMGKTHWFLSAFTWFLSENSTKSDRNRTTEKSGGHFLYTSLQNGRAYSLFGNVYRTISVGL